MDFKIFIGVFITIFMAEFLDKTQLAVMAASASTKSPVSIFAGASAALVVSTLLAVLVGSVLQRFIPQQVVNGGAGVIFIIIGIFLIVNVFHTKAEATVKSAPSPTGLSGKIILQTAMIFEKNSLEKYRKMAEQAESSHLKALFNHLALEEQEHLKNIEKYTIEKKHSDWDVTDETVKEVPGLVLSTEDDMIINDAIEHEQHTFNFYSSLAQKALVPEIRDAFMHLAEEEKSHIAHLEEFRKDGKFYTHT
jgi:rubrerythrin